MKPKIYDIVTNYQTNKEDLQAVLYSAVGGGIAEKDIPAELRFDALNPSEDSVLRLEKIVSIEGLPSVGVL